MSLVVQKFGGTSLADAGKIHLAARRAIRECINRRQVVMVVSAMGRTTDDLLRLASEIATSAPKRELDMLLTTGEQVSIALCAMAIHATGGKAISLTAGQLGLVTDSAHTQARIQSISKERIRRELDAGKVVIVAGFQGIDKAGEITTLGRGASDTTAVALAAVLGAEVCEIYTDVDGVYTADPRLVPQARKIPAIGYDEMLELASLGARVMHSRAVEFGKKYNVPIHVRSSLTNAPGTWIVAEPEGMEDVVVRGATLKRNLAGIVLLGVPNKPGIADEIFARVAEHDVAVDDIMQNIYDHGRLANIGFTIGAGDVHQVETLCRTLADRLGIQRVEVNRDLCKVSVVGIGMRTHTGVAARMFQALSRAGINIEHISTSEILIGCVVKEKDGIRALQVLHDAFELENEPGENADRPKGLT